MVEVTPRGAYVGSLPKPRLRKPHAMYWIRAGGWVDLLGLFVLTGLWSAGGWLVVLHAFRLEPRERLVTGLGVGLTGFIFFSNLAGHWLRPAPAFWIAAGLVFLLGLVSWRPSAGPLWVLSDWRHWKLLVELALIAGGFTLIGRGLAVFDEYNSLPLVSAVAAGDIPPHFYLNAGEPYLYHYAFQLFGASLMRIGSFFPWSALDISRGFLGGLALILAGLWGRRVTHSKIGGTAIALFLAFASGGRWALNFLPYSVLRSATQGITLWGSAADSAATLFDGLSAPWAIEGGPPVPIPLAFANGILPPFVLGVFTGPKSLALIALFLFLLLFPRKTDWRSVVVLAGVFSVWALAAEAEFVLIALGLITMALLVRAQGPGRPWGKEVRPALGSLLPAVLLSLVQGGTITEVARSLAVRLGGPGAAPVEAGLFALRFPLAIVSSHLGELRLDRVGQLLVGLFEIGPILLAAPIALWAAGRWLRRGRYELVAVVLSGVFGLGIPLFLRYSVERDITRLSGSALLDWGLLSVPVLWFLWPRLRAGWMKTGIVIWAATTGFAGVVVLGPLLTAMSRPVFSNDIAVVDAAMTRRFWDELDPSALILDSRSWRAVVVTGRLTRSALDVTTDMPAWRALVESPLSSRVAQQGFTYVYVDKRWWQAMGEEARASYAQSCAVLLGEETDNSDNGFRRLYDVRQCGR